MFGRKRETAGVAELREQVEGLRQLIRLQATGSSLPFGEEGKRIDGQKEAQQEPSHEHIARCNHAAYVSLLGGREYPGFATKEVLAFIRAHPTVTMGRTVYTFEEREVEAMYGDPNDPRATDTFIVVRSSADENQGDHEWPHLSDDAHRRLCRFLKLLSPEG